jgi:DNA polymerase-1
MPAPSVPLLLVLDGNSLLHRAYHAAPIGRLLNADDRPVWALHGLVGYIAKAAARLRPDGLLVGFDCPDDSARKADYPGYKAHRAEKAADLAEQILAAPQLLRATGICTVVPAAYEADDVLASSAVHARRSGWRSVLMTSDRDAFNLIDETTSVLRVRNGGFDEAELVDEATLFGICGVAPGQYRDYAALRGDPSDNLPGVRGFGPATAARLLAEFGSLDGVWAALDAGQTERVGAVVGETALSALCSPDVREVVDRNRRLMRMRTDLALPDLDTVRLPLALAGMRRALAGYGIHLGPSLWALTGGTPPLTEEDLAPFPRSWLWSRGAGPCREPAPDQLALF